MRPLHEWTEAIDKEPHNDDFIIDLAKKAGFVRQQVAHVDELNQKESLYFKIVDY